MLSYLLISDLGVFVVHLLDLWDNNQLLWEGSQKKKKNTNTDPTKQESQ